MNRSTDTLRIARARLGACRAKLDCLASAVDGLEPAQRKRLGPALQSLLDRFVGIENALLKLGRLEEAWGEIGAGMRHDLRELEAAHEALARRIDASDFAGAGRRSGSGDDTPA